MGKKKNNRGLQIIATLYIIGIISSFIIVSPGTIQITNDGVTVLGIIKTFCLNYWYIFIMWVLGLSIIGFIFNLFVIFFRGFVYGVLVIYLIRNNFTYFFAITILDLILFLPLFFTMSYHSIITSYATYKKNHIKNDFYFKLMLISVVLIFIYSCLLEIIGGIYA